MNFAEAHIPRCQFTCDPIDMDTWRRNVKRFKPHAARGLDGFDKEDLLQMPDAFLQPFLHWIEALESGQSDWPKQLLTGAVIGLAKHDGASAAGHYRPITLFSMLFRNWSKIRTRQMIRQLVDYIPPEALGFLPDREAPQVWFVLQGCIELMLQHSRSFCGLSTDLQKAFNNIGRKQVWHLAQHMGLPDSLLTPWKSFLHGFERRFDIHGCFGDAMVSTSGYPEGDPLSIVAMLIVDWSYHLYMRQFAPQVSHYSFVDNLTLAATEALPIIQAFFAMKTFFSLFGLSADDDKTYVWGITKPTRDVLAQLQFPCVTDASELGGSMTYGRAIRNRLLRQRGDKLGPRWDRLKRSWAPTLQKLSILAKVFWPAALHGISSCLVADNYTLDLRRKAVKALRLNGAGSNPMLRLNLQDDPQCDPGFYQIVMTFQQMRRLLRKCPDLTHMWKTWYGSFDGKLLPGPFSQFHHCLELLGWRIIDLPLLCDHEQHAWHLSEIDAKTLHLLLTDAWMQHVAASSKHATMSDLVGLDSYLTLWDATRLNPLDRARLSALHSGAFMTSLEHARFDSEKRALCAAFAQLRMIVLTGLYVLDFNIFVCAYHSGKLTT